MPRTPKQFADIREKTRQHLLDTALELFATKGYHATSISQIAKAAGMAKGALYHYFENKQALFVAIIIETSNKVMPLMQVENAASAEDFLYQFYLRLLHSLKAHKDFWRLYFNLGLQGDLIKEMGELLKPLQQNNMLDISKALAKFNVQFEFEDFLLQSALVKGISLHILFLGPDDLDLEKMAQKMAKAVLE